VLLGAAATIARSRPFFIIEIEPEEAEKVKNYFDPIRYRLIGYDVMLDKFCAGAGTPSLRLVSQLFLQSLMKCCLLCHGSVRLESIADALRKPWIAPTG
jgi:hypothetical protein